jgi:hypothetical protein
MKIPGTETKAIDSNLNQSEKFNIYMHKTKPHKTPKTKKKRAMNMNTKSLLLTIMSAPVAFGYISVSTPSGMTTKPAFGLDRSISATSQRPVREHRNRRSNTYNLGLGKNQPITGRSSIVTDDLESVTQFWIEHEAVNQYPSPVTALTTNVQVQVNEDATSSIQAPPVAKRKQLPVIKPTRKSEDVLNIVSQTEMGIPSVIFQTNPDLKIDLNTVWVEMMIHSQQQLLQFAAN